MKKIEFKKDDIVQMDNISFHGNTEGRINFIFNDEKDGLTGTMKANITWGDYRFNRNWTQITNTPLNMIQLTTKI